VATVVLVIMAIAFGAPWITLVPLKDIAAEVNGERSIPAFASALMWIGSGVGGILMGRIAERLGIRFTVIFGAGMVAVGLALSTRGPSLPLYVGHGLFMGLLGIVGINAPFYVYVSRWFDRRRGSALALISSGAYLAGAFWPPIFERVIAFGVEEFAKIISGLKPYQGIALGAMRARLPDEAKIVVKAKLNGKDGVIARSREYFEFREGKPALAPIDFDKNGMSDAVKKRIGADMWDGLTTVLPALRDVARVMRRSTSSCLYNGDTPLPESRGWHGYVLVKDGSDIKRFLETLHDRCWLNGLGWFYISKAGTPLERSIVDRAVATPEHLLFEGPPTVKPPLRQDTESRRPIAYPGETLDTLSACPDLTSDEQQTVDKLKADEKERIQPEIDRVRAAYINERVEELVKRKGISKEDAVEIVTSQCNGVLSEHVVLAFTDKRLKGCTVGDVLDDPERFQNKSLADPIEGTDYGRTTAKVLLRRDNGYPFIKSFAHGGMSYMLVRKPGDELKSDFPGRIPEYAKPKSGSVLRTSTGMVVVPNWRERNKYGQPIPSMHNARLAILALGIVCRYDTTGRHQRCASAMGKLITSRIPRRSSQRS
jgi:hypothetical protein